MFIAPCKTQAHICSTGCWLQKLYQHCVVLLCCQVVTVCLLVPGLYSVRAAYAMMFMLAPRGIQALACFVNLYVSPGLLRWAQSLLVHGAWHLIFTSDSQARSSWCAKLMKLCYAVRAQAAYLAKLLTHHGVKIPESPILQPDAGNTQQHVQRGTQLGYDVAYKPDRPDGHDLFQSPEQTGTSPRPSSRDIACR